MIVDHYKDDFKVRELTINVMSRGFHVLQIWQTGKCEEAHVRWLAEVARFPEAAKMLDIGCGVGGVAAQIQTIRPDLEAWQLMNRSRSQLDLIPAWVKGVRVVWDLRNTLPYKAIFGGVLLCYSAGHAEDLNKLIEDISRVMLSGGVLLIHDMERTLQPNAGFRAYVELGYNTWTKKEWFHALLRSGFMAVQHDLPVQRNVLTEIAPKDSAGLLHGLKPLLIRAVKS